MIADPKAVELRDAVPAAKSLAKYKERAVAMQNHATDSYLNVLIADLGNVT